MEHKIILASGSPRRKELLESLGLKFDIFPATNPELPKGDTPTEIALNLAIQKANEVYDKHRNEKALVIAADTIVVCDDKILGKPKDEEDAGRMLKMLSYRSHQVITGICIKDESTEIHSTDTTNVSFYKITDSEIAKYLKIIDKNTGKPEWIDKAGGYAIQGYAGTHFVRSIEGDYNNVVGLPISKVYQQLKDIRNCSAASLLPVTSKQRCS